MTPTYNPSPSPTSSADRQLLRSEMSARDIMAALDTAYSSSDEIDLMRDILTAGPTSCPLEVPDPRFRSCFCLHVSSARARLVQRRYRSKSLRVQC